MAEQLPTALTNATAASPGPHAESPSAEFVQLFTRCQRRLFLDILARVAHPLDAEEILQETNLIIWKKAHQFQSGTNFLAWARRIAELEVRRFRQRRRRDRLQFSQAFLDCIAAEVEAVSLDSEPRRRALMECLAKLRPADRELIQRRYAPEQSGLSVAAWLGRPVNSVYQSLSRIRRTLLECVRRRLSAEAGL